MLGRVALNFFQQSPLLAFPLIALGLFMLVFFVITLRTLFAQKTRYDGVACMPLESNTQVVSHASCGQEGARE